MKTISPKRIRLIDALEWRTNVWNPPVEWALENGFNKSVNNPEVLEIGYFSGMMGCYIVQNYDCKLTGFEINKEGHKKANELKEELGLGDSIEFNLLEPDEEIPEDKQYDVIFFKSFLYHNKSEETYTYWLKKIKRLLKKDGILIGIENGQGDFLTKLYRKKLMSDCTWKDNYFFNSWVKTQLEQEFSEVEFKYFNKWSQFFADFDFFFNFVKNVESKVGKIDSDNCFIASFVAKK